MSQVTTSSSAREEMGSKDGHSVTKRLQKELMSLMMAGEQGFSAFPENDNMFKWIGTIKGPQGTVYEGLTYKISLEFPSTYPFSSPTVKFITQCFHPNVDTAGNICLDILKDKWSALYDVRMLLVSIQSLLGEPNTSSPLNVAAADMWSNQEMYKKVLHDKYRSATNSQTSDKS